MVTEVERGLAEPIEVTGTVTATVTNPLPVSGTFYQETQPVSGTVAVSSLPSIPHDTLTSTDVVSMAKTALTPAAPTAVSVGVTTGQAVASNVNRKGLMLVNTSANYISIGIGAAAVLYSGITLNPGGGAFWMDEFCFSTGAVNAIASGATSNLGVTEFT